MSTIAQTLEQIQRQKALWDAAQPLPASLLEQLRKDWEVTQTYNSNAIEGNTLTLAETKVILLHGVTVGGKQINEHLAATNHRDAMFLMRYAAQMQMKRPLEEILVLELHRILLSRIDDEDAGRYRPTRTSVTGSGRIFPNSVQVSTLMAEFVDKINAMTTAGEHPVLIASAVHFGMFDIRPFNVANGRIARLLMNLIFLHHEYPPVLVPVEQLVAYVHALRAIEERNVTVLDKFIAQITLQSLETMVAVVA